MPKKRRIKKVKDRVEIKKRRRSFVLDVDARDTLRISVTSYILSSRARGTRRSDVPMAEERLRARPWWTDTQFFGLSEPSRWRQFPSTWSSVAIMPISYENLPPMP